MIGEGLIFHDLIFDYTLRTVAIGSAILGIVSGALGSFAILRKQSLLGDAISHAALPGIAIAFILSGQKQPFILIFGAAVAGWLGTLLVMSVIRSTRIKEDGALGIVLSVFFGFGLVLLTYIQKLPLKSKAGLETYIFGQAASLIQQDVIAMLWFGIPVLVVLALLWKEFRLLSFDPDYCSSIGFSVRFLDVTLLTLIVISIVIGLQTVGAILMSAMLVAPAAAARQWTDRLGFMVILSAIFGAVAGISGAVISSTVEHLPTGPTIVLCVGTIVFVSILFAPNRGLVWNQIRMGMNNRRLQLLAVLEDLYVLSQQHENQRHPHSLAVIRAMSEGHGGSEGSLKILVEKGFATAAENGWTITEKGIAEIENYITGKSTNVTGTT
ncbi:MAG TPA: metal ABC transporter permease [bacterium]|jgi:manganese/zinc/iron transport system permease protein